MTHPRNAVATSICVCCFMSYRRKKRTVASLWHGWFCGQGFHLTGDAFLWRQNKAILLTWTVWCFSLVCMFRERVRKKQFIVIFPEGNSCMTSRTMRLLKKCNPVKVAAIFSSLWNHAYDNNKKNASRKLLPCISISTFFMSLPLRIIINAFFFILEIHKLWLNFVD